MIILLLFLVIGAAAKPGCHAPGALLNRGAQKCYLFVSEALSFSDASEYCQNQNMQLASSTCGWENRFIGRKSGELFKNEQPTWIGLRHNDGVYKWEDKEIFQYSKWERGALKKPEGDCVYLLSTFDRWLRGNCDEKKSFVCKSGPITISEPKTDGKGKKDAKSSNVEKATNEVSKEDVVNNADLATSENPLEKDVKVNPKLSTTLKSDVLNEEEAIISTESPPQKATIEATKGDVADSADNATSGNLSEKDVEVKPTFGFENKTKATDSEANEKSQDNEEGRSTTVNVVDSSDEKKNNGEATNTAQEGGENNELNNEVPQEQEAKKTEDNDAVVQKVEDVTKPSPEHQTSHHQQSEPSKSPCELEWNLFEGECYKVFYTPAKRKDHYEAYRKCREHNSYLTSPKSQASSNFLRDVSRKVYGRQNFNDKFWNSAVYDPVSRTLQHTDDVNFDYWSWSRSNYRQKHCSVLELYSIATRAIYDTARIVPCDDEFSTFVCKRLPRHSKRRACRSLSCRGGNTL